MAFRKFFLHFLRQNFAEVGITPILCRFQADEIALAIHAVFGADPGSVDNLNVVGDDHRRNLLAVDAFVDAVGEDFVPGEVLGVRHGIDYGTTPKLVKWFGRDFHPILVDAVHQPAEAP